MWSTRLSAGGLGEIFRRDLRLLPVALVVTLLVSIRSGPEPATERPAAYSSHVALNLAHQLEETVLGLRFDDPRLRETDGFVSPELSLIEPEPLRPDGAPAGGGYTVRWRILDDVPARDMKRIEIRITWPVRDEEGTLSTVTVKAS